MEAPTMLLLLAPGLRALAVGPAAAVLMMKVFGPGPDCRGPDCCSLGVPACYHLAACLLYLFPAPLTS